MILFYKILFYSVIIMGIIIVFKIQLLDFYARKQKQERKCQCQITIKES